MHTLRNDFVENQIDWNKRYYIALIICIGKFGLSFPANEHGNMANGFECQSYFCFLYFPRNIPFNSDSFKICLIRLFSSGKDFLTTLKLILSNPTLLFVFKDEKACLISCNESAGGARLSSLVDLF